MPLSCEGGADTSIQTPAYIAAVARALTRVSHHFVVSSSLLDDGLGRYVNSVFGFGGTHCVTSVVVVGCAGGQSNSMVETRVMTLVIGWAEGQVLEARGRSGVEVESVESVERLVDEVISSLDVETEASASAEVEASAVASTADLVLVLVLVLIRVNQPLGYPTPRGLYSTWWGGALWAGG